MTKSTPGISNPLAATSVATNNGISPDLNCSTAFVRPSWLLSPWILVTFHPVRLKLFSIRSASFLYSTNMRIRFFLSLWYFLRSCCSLCSLALSSKTSTIWVILVPAARSSLPMVTLMKRWKIIQNQLVIAYTLSWTKDTVQWQVSALVHLVKGIRVKKIHYIHEVTRGN